MKSSSLKPEQSPARRPTWKKFGQIIIYAFCLFLFVFVTLEVSSRLAAKDERRPQEKTGQEKTEEQKIESEKTRTQKTNTEKKGIIEKITLEEEAKQTDWTRSQISPLHRVPLMDEFNEQIVPAAPSSLPLSTRYTCAPCHEYETISQGLHFNLKKRPAVDRPSEPWVLVDDKTGVQLPISYANFPGLWKPEQIGLSDWQFVSLFGRNLNGGGPGEPGEKEITADSRWSVSGRLEINCFGCHNGSPLQDHSEWVKQVMRENFRWAATAASGLGEVKGMASRLPSTWDIIDGPNPDDHEWAVVPEVKYNQTLFDSQNNALLDLKYQPDDSRCLACHSVTARKAETKAAVERDVHALAGLKCVDCHRNDLSHQMVRGFQGEKTAIPGIKPDSLTCAGCHLGERPEKGGEGYAGFLGAPRPAHRGIPKVHFERLACTVCHSGLMPEKEPQEIYTSRANRLGIFGKANWTADYPLIVEPVFVREKDNKIYPERMMWPAFWAEKKGKELMPLTAQTVLEISPGIFEVKETVASLLNCLYPLAEEGYDPAVLISNFLFEPNVDGSLDVHRVKLSKKAAPDKFLLMQKKGSEVKLLLPAFNPDEATAEMEDKILNVLNALKLQKPAKEPALLVGKVIYRLEEGYLQKEEIEQKEVKEGKEDESVLPALGWLEDNTVRPLFDDFWLRTLCELGDSRELLTEEQIALGLKRLSETNPSREFCYVASGQVFSLDKDGKLRASQHPAARAVSWPLAHNVRPAQQALGKNSCTDCHSLNSKVFFGKIEAPGPLKTRVREEKLSSDLMKTGSFFQWIFGLTFAVRPALKLVLAGCLLVIGLILLAVFLRAGRKASGLAEETAQKENRR